MKARSECMAIGLDASSTLSSSFDHLPFIIPGFKVLVQRWRHWESSRPGTNEAISLHCRAPYLATAALSFASSSFVHFRGILGSNICHQRVPKSPDRTEQSQQEEGVFLGRIAE